ncbi:MAG: pyridoxal-phosphate dependent enzyme [Wenzhouxiangella sp.]
MTDNCLTIGHAEFPAIMKYLSTAGQARPVDLSGALLAGLAPDGGLFVPESLPAFQPDTFLHNETLPETATQALAPFFAGSELADSLAGICQQALDLPLPLREFESGRSWLLELYHGPTAAFKDFAARFLASCLGQLRDRNDPIQTVLVATSGDTGGAVAAAFHRRPGFRVVILYPDGKVSARQAHQLGHSATTCMPSAFRVTSTTASAWPSSCWAILNKSGATA